VLVVQPTETGEAPAFACHRVLVPLDGNPDHEQGLPVVRDLIRVCGAALHLVMVVPTLGTLSGPPASAAMLMPGATSAMLDMSEEEAAAYLERQALGLQQAGLSITAEVARGDPADVIAGTAQRINADLIVLSTHGKTGMDAFWSGSLTPRVSSRAGIPTLLVRVEGPGADPLR
jgi:nucleotide-binding universal stress UspA family protein